MRSETLIEKNQLIEIEIESLTNEAYGVGHIEGMAIFVRGALPTERVRAHVIKTKKRYAIAVMKEILVASPHRSRAMCPVFDQCGGCSLQHLDYAEQLKQKQRWAIESFERIAKVGNVQAITLPIIGVEKPFRYRNKASFPIQQTVQGESIYGFFAAHSHRLIAIDDCLLQQEAIIKTMNIVHDWIKQYHIQPYNEIERTGALRHVMIRQGNVGESLILVLITHTKKIQYTDELKNILLEKKVPVQGIIHNIQPDGNNVIMGKISHVLWGENKIEEQIHDFLFDVSAESFMQVNAIQTDKLYEKVLEFANLQGDEIVMDAYCGIGTMSLLLARQAKYVYGVEIVKQAVRDAEKNAEKNAIKNVSFLAESAELFLSQWASDGKTCDVLVLDPPRKGCEPMLLDAVIAMKPERIVYVSCDVATMARDISKLKEYYDIKKIQPVDMFPQTTNLETIALLIKK